MVVTDIVTRTHEIAFENDWTGTSNSSDLLLKSLTLFPFHEYPVCFRHRNILFRR